MERTEGMVVGFGMLCLVLSLKSMFSGIQSPLFTIGLLGIFVGVPLLLKEKTSRAQAVKKRRWF